jgi:drug/metabolite transporter (DMT)-like permease
MNYLIIVSLIWAFSFGLIKGNLVGLDASFVAFARLMLSFIFFAVFLRIKQFNLKQILQLLIIGAVQFGLMYIFYIYSYGFLKAWQIALFTIFTPLYVTLLNDILNRTFNLKFLLAASLSVIGAAIIVFNEGKNLQLTMGFLLMQISNFCFAAGQVYYRKIRISFKEIKDHVLFAWVYFGAFLVSLINSLIITDYSAIQLSQIQIYTLLYLGIVASGICFFLWNLGATKVNGGTLAVFNNLKVPLGVAVSIFVFDETGDLIKMIAGGIVIVVALYISEHFNSLKSQLADN